MIDLKPYGAFIQFTIRPLLDEFRACIKDLERNGIKLDDHCIGRVFSALASLHFWSLALNSLTQILTVTLICYTVLQLR